MVRRKRKTRRGWVICSCWNGRLRWWLRIYLGGWLGTSDACGRSPWQLVPGVRLPRSRPTRRWRASPAASLPPITPTGLPAVPGQRPRLGSTATPSRVVTLPVRKGGPPEGDPESETGPGAHSVAAPSTNPNVIRRPHATRRPEDPRTQCDPTPRPDVPMRPTYRCHRRHRCDPMPPCGMTYRCGKTYRCGTTCRCDPGAPLTRAAAEAFGAVTQRPHRKPAPAGAVCRRAVRIQVRYG